MTYKIVKSAMFKKQEKTLPKSVKKELKQAMNAIMKDPYNVPGSMNVFGPPSPEELKNWASETSVEKIDLIFEYLAQKKCLNTLGKKLAKDFWAKYLKKKEGKVSARKNTINSKVIVINNKMVKCFVPDSLLKDAHEWAKKKGLDKKEAGK